MGFTRENGYDYDTASFDILIPRYFVPQNTGLKPFSILGILAHLIDDFDISVIDSGRIKYIFQRYAVA